MEFGLQSLKQLFAYLKKKNPRTSKERVGLVALYSPLQELCGPQLDYFSPSFVEMEELDVYVSHGGD